MITKEQFDNLRVGSRVLHSKDYGCQHDLYGCFGTVIDRIDTITTVQWDSGAYPTQKYMGGRDTLACFDPCPQLSTININEII